MKAKIVMVSLVRSRNYAIAVFTREGKTPTRYHASDASIVSLCSLIQRRGVKVVPFCLVAPHFIGWTATE